MEPFVISKDLATRLLACNKQLTQDWSYELYEVFTRILRQSGLHGIVDAMNNGSAFCMTHVADGVYGGCIVPAPVWVTKPVSYDNPEHVVGSWKIGKKNVTKAFMSSPLWVKLRYTTRKILELTQDEWAQLHNLGRRNMVKQDELADEPPPSDMPQEFTQTQVDSLPQSEFEKLADETFGGES